MQENNAINAGIMIFKEKVHEVRLLFEREKHELLKQIEGNQSHMNDLDRKFAG